MSDLCRGNPGEISARTLDQQFFKHQEIAREIFGTFNLNSHGNKRGIKSLSPFKDISWYHEGHSEHSPLLTAIRDFFPEDVMWEKISQCDINQNWSATIIQINGRLRCYFCEVAASFDLARGEDHGFEVAAGWWKRSIGDFSEQIRHFCPTCGVPAKFAGVADHEEIDMYSESNRNIALKSLGKKRKINRDQDYGTTQRVQPQGDRLFEISSVNELAKTQASEREIQA